MKKFFCYVVLLFTFLFSLDLKVYNTNVKLDNIIYVKSLKDINFSKDIAILPATMMDFVINNNLEIIGGYEKDNRYILLNKRFSDIKTIANVDLIAKIFLKTIKKQDLIFKQASLEDFFSHKVDGIVVNHSIYSKNIIQINLEMFGIKFNKFLLVTSKELAKKYEKELFKLKNKIAIKYSLDDELVFNGLFHTAYYLNKKIKYLDFVFKDIKLNKKFYKVAVTPNWEPIDIYDGKELKGIGVDMFKLIAKKANINYKIVLQPNWQELINDFKLGIFDMTPNTSETEDRKKFAIFTKPYIKFPLAIICKKDSDIKSIEDIKSLAVGKHFTAEKLMKKYYPNLNYITLKNIHEVINYVESEKAQCGVDIMPVMVYNLQQKHINDLSIKFLTPFEFELQIMLKKGLEHLRDRFNKIIDSLTEEEKQRVINKYINVAIIEKQKINYLEFTIIAFLIIVILYFYYFKTKYKKEANFDPLINIYNKRFLEKYIKENSDIKASIIYFDIDHFKKVNDTYGHEFGDFILKEFANVIKSNIRENDIFIRNGGEEFLLILPNVSYENALKIAEKLRKSVENHKFKDINITASFGVAFKNSDDDFEKTIKKADTAMYLAKQNGRNQVKGFK